MDEKNVKLISRLEEERIRAKYWEDNGIEPEETFEVNLEDLANLYPVKNYSSTTPNDKK